MNHPDTVLAQALFAGEAKMRAAGATTNCIAAFLSAMRRLREPGAGFLPESLISPVSSLPRLEDLPGATEGRLLEKLVVIKLNGGLGTKMGLDTAKSLVRVKGDHNFLDFIARQILWLRERSRGAGPAFLLMDSFRTQRDTLEYLTRYPELSAPGFPQDFIQSKVPKLDAETLLPVSFPPDPDLEWCPPGHGDIYPSLADSGLLDRLLAKGVEFAFVSNSDNLAATVDLPLLSYFAGSGLGFLMEVAERTETDRKGGHLARRVSDGRLVLREVAQCPDEDRVHFESGRHRFFNTNNLWINLRELRRTLKSLVLPIIKNVKPINPQDPASRRVVQLETAMGAAIECFENAGAIQVPRSRFSPVKDTADLLALRSDAYEITDDFRLALAGSRGGRPPVIKLDGDCFSQLADFEKSFAAGAPSLLGCEELSVQGPWRFNAGIVCRGSVRFVNETPSPSTAASRRYEDEIVN
jgi:UDP-N-acetylglucosamine pyrophosphorylase